MACAYQSLSFETLVLILYIIKSINKVFVVVVVVIGPF